MEKTTTAIYNSEGIDVSYEKSSVNGEFVVQCITPQDVEQYQEFAYDDLDTEALTAQAKGICVIQPVIKALFGNADMTADSDAVEYTLFYQRCV